MQATYSVPLPLSGLLLLYFPLLQYPSQHLVLILSAKLILQSSVTRMVEHALGALTATIRKLLAESVLPNCITEGKKNSRSENLKAINNLRKRNTLVIPPPLNLLGRTGNNNKIVGAALVVDPRDVVACSHCASSVVVW